MKDPAFLFYTGDFLAGTMFFTDEQVGIYLRLLLAQHQHGRLSEKQVNFICKSYDNEVLKKFEKDEDGNYYNLRLEIEINKRKSYSESRSNNRKGKVKKDKPKRKKTSITYDVHMEDRDKDINKDKKEDESEILKTPLEKKFDEFLEYRKQIKKPVVEKSLQPLKNKLWELSNKNTETAIEILDQTITNGWQGIFELKNNNNGKQATNPNQQIRDKIRTDLERKITDRINQDSARP